MSNRISLYVFEEYDDRNNAAEQIYHNCGGSSAYEKDDSYYMGGYGLYILSNCTNVSHAVKYCEGNKGIRRNF